MPPAQREAADRMNKLLVLSPLPSIALPSTAPPRDRFLSISPCQTVVGPVGLEPTTRGLKKAGRQSMEIRVRLSRPTISRAGVLKSGAVAVSVAVKAAEEKMAAACTGNHRHGD